MRWTRARTRRACCTLSPFATAGSNSRSSFLISVWLRKRHPNQQDEKGSGTHQTHENVVGALRSHHTATSCAPVRANRVKNRVCCKLAGVPFRTLRRSNLVVMLCVCATTDRLLALDEHNGYMAAKKCGRLASAYRPCRDACTTSKERQACTKNSGDELHARVEGQTERMMIAINALDTACS